MATSIRVTIVTPERKVLDTDASDLVLPAWNGELGVFPDHDQLLTLLRSGRCIVSLPGQGSQEFVLGRGFAEITATSVTILTSSCVAVAAVDRAKAVAGIAAAEEAVAAAEFGTEAHKQAQIALEHARALADA